MPIITTAWMHRNNGQTSELNLAGKYLVNAEIQWRGVSGVRGTATGERSNSTALWTGTGEKTAKIPGINSSEEVFRRHSLYTTSLGGGTACNRWTSSHSWVCGTASKSQTTTVWRAGQTAGFKVYGVSGGSSYGVAYTSYYYILKTTNPYVTVGGKTTAYSGIVHPGQESPWVVMKGAGDPLLESNANNTLTHSSAAYNDTRNGSCAQLEFRIKYEYIEYPSVVSSEPDNIEATTTRVKGNLQATGGGIVTRYFRYRKDDANWSDPGTLIEDLDTAGVGAFQATLTNLDVNQVYYFQAYATGNMYSPYYDSTWSLTTYGDNLDPNNWFQTIASAPTIQTQSAITLTTEGGRLRGKVISTGGYVPNVYFDYGETTAYELGRLSAGASDGDFHYDLTGLDYNTLYYYRALGISDEGGADLTGYGARLDFTTLYPYLPAPTDREPEAAYRTEDRQPVFEFTLGENTENPAAKYHARIRFSQYVGMEPLTREAESKDSQTGWEYWDGLAWSLFPAFGVDPDTKVRFTPVNPLPYGVTYWDCAGWDGDRYGIDASARVVRVLINVEGYYTLIVNSIERDVYNDVKVIEASNGELGAIEFSLKKDEANPITYGDSVTLALRDWRDTVEEFTGRVRRIEPVGDMLFIQTILGDGYLAERRIKQNYPTDEVIKNITAFAAGDDGLVEKSISTEADWLDSFTATDIAVRSSSLELDAVVDYYYYTLGTEDVAWVAGYSAGGEGAQSKESNHLYLNTLNANENFRTYVTDSAIDLTDLDTIEFDWAVIPGDEIALGSAWVGVGTVKDDVNFDASSEQKSSLGRSVTSVDVSGLAGNHYIKVMTGSTSFCNMSARIYRVWGENEFGRVIGEYEATGEWVSQPIDLSNVTDVYESIIQWQPTTPSGTSLAISCGINTVDNVEPASYSAATSGSSIPGINLTDDLTGKYLWIKAELESNPTRTQTPSVASIQARVNEDGYFGVIVTSTAHNLVTDDKVYIEGDNKYNGVWTVEVIDVDSYVIDTAFETDAGAVGTGKLVEDIGLYVRDMIAEYCAPVTTEDYIDTATGFIAPIDSKDKTAISVLEGLRRRYGLFYFVDRDNRLHFYTDAAVISPEAVVRIRRGDPDE